MISTPCIQIAERRITLLLAFAIACSAVSYSAYRMDKEQLDEDLLKAKQLSEVLSEHLGEDEIPGNAGGTAYFWKSTYPKSFRKRSNFWKRYDNQAFWKRRENSW